MAFFFAYQGLEMGAVDILIVWENLEIHRIVLKNHQTDGKREITLQSTKLFNLLVYSKKDCILIHKVLRMF